MNEEREDILRAYGLVYIPDANGITEMVPV